jgi:thiol-disulfide isomerase/thioredoxin
LLASLAGYGWFRQPPIQPALPATVSESQAAVTLSVHDEPRTVPAIQFTDADGRPLTLADFRGRVVLLNIWATWCVPCRKEMPALDRLEGKLGGRDFIVLPLSIDRNGLPAVKPFYQELGLEKLGIYLDPSGRGSRALAIPGVPATILIDREGREAARKMGPAEWDGAEMIALIRRYLSSSAAETEQK